MKLKTIFADEVTSEGLHSICLKGSISEYETLFKFWNDISRIRKYCIENFEYLQSGFYGDISLEQAIMEIKDEVDDMYQKIVSTNNFNQIFQPLNDNEYRITELSKSKIKLLKKKNRISKLRLYAIKITDNCFVVTGGAIKLTKGMEDHNDTIIEREKLTKVKDWLKEQGIFDEEGLNYYYYEQE